MYINLFYLPTFNFAYLFFLSFPLNIFVSFIFIALFPNWHLALLLLSSCAFTSFVLVDIIFGLLCLLGQIIVLNLCWTVLILLMGVMYMCIFSHTFYCCYKPLPLHWAVAVLCFPVFPFFFLLPFCFFSLFYNFNFLNIFYLSTFIPLCAFPTVFPLQLIMNVYTSSSSTSI